ncbi:MBL fold metallo-hydrolase [Candidatus Poribacteria bacterium]
MTKPAGNFSIKFWGTRGSIPSPGPGTLKYGGNTSCLEIRCGGELIIIDAGTGIRDLGTKLLKEMPVKAAMLFSHMHWDHIQGMPFFRPAYVPGNEFKIYGSRDWDTKLEYVLRWQMQKPNFPITLEEVNEVGAHMEYIDIDSRTVFQVGDTDAITVRSVELYHPDKAFGFRIEYGGRSLVYATDTESLPGPYEKLVELALGADMLIHDAQYTSEEYYGLDGVSRENWGHSTPEAAAAIAVAANVKKLVLFHHDPYHDDAQVDQMVQTASAIFPDTIAASEGMVVELQPTADQAEPHPEETNAPRLYSRLASSVLE